MHKDIRRQADDILAHLRTPSGTTGHATDEQASEGSIRVIDIHVYDVPNEAESEPPSIESTLGEYPPEADDQEREPYPLEPQTAPAPTRSHWHPLAYILPPVCLCLIGVMLWVYVLPLWAPTATITLIPISRPITATGTITVVTGITADAHMQQIPGRVLSSITMSQAQTIPTTGTVHQDASAAHGTITFYNFSTTVQTIPAGTLLTGADGIQVITEQDTTIPAGTLATNGQANVTAHTVITGPAGNIAAGDIYGPCCRLNISAASSAFTGGQNARSYQAVTQQDITGSAASLKTSLDQSVQAALQTQVRSNETLITPLPCQQTVTSDHQPGDEAAQVQITESETCTGAVYSTSAYQALVTQIVTQQAVKQLGAGYSQVGTIQASITHTISNDHGTIELHINGAGTWVYQFDQERMQRITNQIAGKSKAQALTLLLHTPGIQSASMSITNGDATLPTDATHVHVIFLVPA